MKKALINGALFNGDAYMGEGFGLVIDGDRIEAVGTMEEIRSSIDENTEIIDCQGKLISPGFNDSHTHIAYGSFLLDPDFGLNFEGKTDKDEYLQALKGFADDHLDNEWVYGYNGGWGAGDIPDRRDLDAYMADRPMVIQHMDGHSLVANTAAIKKMGVHAGFVLKDGGHFDLGSDGEPDGRFYDEATFMYSEALYSGSDDRFKKVFGHFMQEASRNGITAAGDLYPTFVNHEDVYDVYKQMEEEGILTVRMTFSSKLIGFDYDSYQEKRKKYDSDMLRLVGAKELADGVITVRTAYMLEPYSDDPSTCGAPINDPEEMKSCALDCIKHGIGVRFHCIGDAAVRMALDIFEEGKKLYGSTGYRSGIEHIESIHPDDIPRFRELDIMANIQPMHAVFDTAAEENFRGERCSWCWAVRDLLDAGAKVSFGTDFPIVGLNPFHTIYAAVTRKDPFGILKEGWQKHQAVTVEEAMRAHTWGAAYATGREDRIGSLKPGMYADIAVINDDLFRMDPEEIKDATVYMTMLGGRIVYRQ